MSSLNAIAVEAYKKYILVSLIQNGQVRFRVALSSGKSNLIISYSKFISPQGLCAVAMAR
jgi:hypothetical protein